jgi:hypothetical protein
LIFLWVRLANKKIRQSAVLPKASGEFTDNIQTKAAVVPAFIHFGLEFREPEILVDLPRHQLDIFGQ